MLAAAPCLGRRANLIHPSTHPPTKQQPAALTRPPSPLTLLRWPAGWRCPAGPPGRPRLPASWGCARKGGGPGGRRGRALGPVGSGDAALSAASNLGPNHQQYQQQQAPPPPPPRPPPTHPHPTHIPPPPTHPASPQLEDHAGVRVVKGQGCQAPPCGRLQPLGSAQRTSSWQQPASQARHDTTRYDRYLLGRQAMPLVGHGVVLCKLAQQLEVLLQQSRQEGGQAAQGQLATVQQLRRTGVAGCTRSAGCQQRRRLAAASTPRAMRSSSGAQVPRGQLGVRT